MPVPIAHSSRTVSPNLRPPRPSNGSSSLRLFMLHCSQIQTLNRGPYALFILFARRVGAGAYPPTFGGGHSAQRTGSGSFHLAGQRRRRRESSRPAAAHRSAEAARFAQSSQATIRLSPSAHYHFGIPGLALGPSA